MLNLDTHILSYAVAGDLPPREKGLLSKDAWITSAIALWEIAKLAQLERLEADPDPPEFTRTLAQVHACPFTLSECGRSAMSGFALKGARSDPTDVCGRSQRLFVTVSKARDRLSSAHVENCPDRNSPARAPLTDVLAAGIRMEPEQPAPTLPASAEFRCGGFGPDLLLSH